MSQEDKETLRLNVEGKEVALSLSKQQYDWIKEVIESHDFALDQQLSLEEFMLMFIKEAIKKGEKEQEIEQLAHKIKSSLDQN